ncbi:MAG: hypothetical protein VW714_03740 [Rhodospirillales bacterium]
MEYFSSPRGSKKALEIYDKKEYMDGGGGVIGARILLAILLLILPSTAQLSEIKGAGTSSTAQSHNNSGGSAQISLENQVNALVQELDIAKKTAANAEAQAKALLEAEMNDLKDQRTYAIIAAVIMFLIAMFALFRKPRPISQ